MGRADEIEDKFEQSGDSGEVRNLGVLDDLDEMGQSEMRAFASALGRIKDGIFGDCVSFSDPIDPDCLKTLPHTDFCKAYAP